MFASSIKPRVRNSSTGKPVTRGRFTVRRAAPDGEQPGVGNPIENVKQAVGADAEGRTVVKEDLTPEVRHPATPASAVSDTLEPRVRQLRGKQLSEGTSDFGQLMKFSGPAPELINGRLAMIGFFAAIGAELSSHTTIFKQLSIAPAPILGFSVLIAIASLIPMVRGTKLFDDGMGEGIRPGFNVTNELINGRAAMVGLVMLIIFESGSRQPLF